MGYLICEECGMQYKLKEGETAEDFIDCECGGNLKEVENLKHNNLTQSAGSKGDNNEIHGQIEENKVEKQYNWLGKAARGVSVKTIPNPSNVPKPIKPKNTNSKNTNSQDIICQKCGTKNPNTAKFCTECASPLSDKASKKFCSQCGTENPPEAQFCLKCGEKLSIKTPNNPLKTDNEYLKVLKQQEQHSKDIKQIIFVIFVIVFIIAPLVWLWYTLNMAPKYPYYYP